MAGDLVGHEVGRYRIVEQLGRGGMAVVYKAFDTRLNRNVALKVISPEHSHSEEFLKRFYREAQAIAQLSHPHIVKVHDYGEHEGTPYLVMEYLPGGMLKDKAGMPMPYQEAARLLGPIAQALAYAHERNVVHRDVKPANILLTETGAPMLSDFGIAKIIAGESPGGELTATGVGIGTPEYMAPEQGMGQPVDARSDIYALGVVLYELITGRKPFQADTPMAVVIKHMSAPLPLPTSFVPGLPESVEQVIFKAMAKKPEDRFQSMADFANALDKLAHSQPADVGPVIPPTELFSTDEAAGIAATSPGQPTQQQNRLDMRQGPSGLIVGVGVAVVLFCCIAGLAGGAVLFGASYLLPAQIAEAPVAPTTDNLPGESDPSQAEGLDPLSAAATQEAEQAGQESAGCVPDGFTVDFLEVSRQDQVTTAFRTHQANGVFLSLHIVITNMLGSPAFLGDSSWLIDGDLAGAPVSFGLAYEPSNDYPDFVGLPPMTAYDMNPNLPIETYLFFDINPDTTDLNLVISDSYGYNYCEVRIPIP